MVTIRDVARHAGVSVSAVSKYLRTPQNMRDDTRERISSAIDELDYHPNMFAQSLRSGKSGFVAIEVPDMTNMYCSALMKYMEKRCSELGLLPLIFETSDAFDVSKILDMFKIGLISGAVCFVDNKLKNALLKNNLSIPVVQIAPTICEPDVSTVFIDLSVGMDLLVRHLAEQKIRTLSLAGPLSDSSGKQKINALMDCCQKYSIQFNDMNPFYKCKDYNDCYIECVNMLKQSVKLPDAIVCVSDHIAVGILKGLVENGIRIPDDILISGFDDTVIASMSNPSLTSVHSPLMEIGVAAIDLLFGLINGGGKNSVTFSQTLSIRTSTSCRRT